MKIKIKTNDFKWYWVASPDSIGKGEYHTKKILVRHELIIYNRHEASKTILLDLMLGGGCLWCKIWLFFENFGFKFAPEYN